MARGRGPADWLEKAPLIAAKLEKFISDGVDPTTIKSSELCGKAERDAQRAAQQLWQAIGPEGEGRYTDFDSMLSGWSSYWNIVRKEPGKAKKELENYKSRNATNGLNGDDNNSNGDDDALVPVLPNGGNNIDGNIVAGGNIGVMVPANADASAGSVPKMGLNPTKLIGKRHLPGIIKQTVTVSMVEEALAGTSIVKSEGADRDYFDPLVPDLLSELVDVAKADGRKSVNFAAPALNAEWLHDGMEKMNGYFKNASNPLCDYGGHLHSKFVAAVAGDDFVTVALCLRQVEVFEGKAGGAAWRRTPWHRQYVTDREGDPAFQPSVRDVDAMDLTESPGVCNLTVAGGGYDDDDDGGQTAAAAAAASDAEGTGRASVKMEIEEEGREEEKKEEEEEIGAPASSFTGDANVAKSSGEGPGPKRRRVALGRSLAVGGPKPSANVAAAESASVGVGDGANKRAPGAGLAVGGGTSVDLRRSNVVGKSTGADQSVDSGQQQQQQQRLSLIRRQMALLQSQQASIASQMAQMQCQQASIASHMALLEEQYRFEMQNCQILQGGGVLTSSVGPESATIPATHVFGANEMAGSDAETTGRQTTGDEEPMGGAVGMAMAAGLSTSSNDDDNAAAAAAAAPAAAPAAAAAALSAMRDNTSNSAKSVEVRWQIARYAHERRTMTKCNVDSDLLAQHLGGKGNASTVWGRCIKNTANGAFRRREAIELCLKDIIDRREYVVRNGLTRDDITLDSGVDPSSIPGWDEAAPLAPAAAGTAVGGGEGGTVPAAANGSGGTSGSNEAAVGTAGEAEAGAAAEPGGGQQLPVRGLRQLTANNTNNVGGGISASSGSKRGRGRASGSAAGAGTNTSPSTASAAASADASARGGGASSVAGSTAGSTATGSPHHKRQRPESAGGAAGGKEKLIDEHKSGLASNN